jgi:ATP-dependent Clp protease ATP-binding subunit ClpC
LTEAVRRRPYQVILFDEIEKAHPEVWNALLQILEDGRLTDGQGHTVDFRNTVIIMTSNIGTKFAMYGDTLGFLKSEQVLEDDREAKREIKKGLKKTFRPEFLNRIDEVIIFHVLTEEDVRQIVDLQMREISQRLADKGITIELTEAARDWLAKEGYDPQFGARPLRRTLQRRVESPLSIRLLHGEFKEGDMVVVDIGEEGIVFRHKEEEPIAVELPTPFEAEPA